MLELVLRVLQLSTQPSTLRLRSGHRLLGRGAKIHFYKTSATEKVQILGIYPNFYGKHHKRFQPFAH